jgi:putative oxidoreductase
MTQGFFGNIGLSPELVIPIGLLEVLGGFALLVGIVTRIASILFIIEMIGVIAVVKLSEGFVGGFELELLLISIAISLLLTGPGKISVEYDILKREIFPKGKKIVNEVRLKER